MITKITCKLTITITENDKMKLHSLITGQSSCELVNVLAHLSHP